MRAQGRRDKNVWSVALSYKVRFADIFVAGIIFVTFVLFKPQKRYPVRLPQNVTNYIHCINMFLVAKWRQVFITYERLDTIIIINV